VIAMTPISVVKAIKIAIATYSSSINMTPWMGFRYSFSKYNIG